MVAKFLDLKKPWSCNYGGEKRKTKLTCLTFLRMIALRNNAAAQTFLPSFDKWPSLSRKVVEI